MRCVSPFLIDYWLPGLSLRKRAVISISLLVTRATRRFIFRGIMEAGIARLSLSLFVPQTHPCEDAAMRIDGAGGRRGGGRGGLGTEGADFKCTGGIKMAFLIPCKSNKPHPFEIPLAAGALALPLGAFIRSAPVGARVPAHVNQALCAEDAPPRQNANDRSSCAGSHKCHCFTFQESFLLRALAPASVLPRRAEPRARTALI